MFHKNRFLLIVLALALSLTMVFGCSDDDNPADPGGGGGDDSGLDNIGSVSGIVLRDGGSPLSGATVSAGSQSTTTNEDGYFVLAAVPEGPTLVSFTYDGFMSTFRMAQVSSATAIHFADVVLVASEFTEFSSAAGSQIVAPGGDAVVNFDADSFVNGAGDTYNGDVTVQINAMTPDDSEFYGSFPGEFAGVREDGSEVTLVSYGFMAIELTAADKTPLLLADGMTAELNLTISPDKVADAPATMPMWYFDESDGQWHEDGVATLNGNTYTADVEHFTTWNWDVPITDICSITGIVVDESGRPVPDARVLSQGIDAAIMAEAFTGTDGSFTINALKNSLTDVWATSGSRASVAARVTVLEECPVALADPLVLEVPAYTISLTWGAEPSDLDTHWYIPATWTTDYDLYRIYYGNQGLMGEDPYASLDTDDTSSYGPEIISGTRLYNGRFQYWIHDYSSNSSTVLQASEASVQLEVAGTLRQYNAADVSLEDADTTGWWHVFDIVISAEGESVTVEPVMEFQPQYTDGIIYPDNGGGGDRITGKK